MFLTCDGGSKKVLERWKPDPLNRILGATSHEVGGFTEQGNEGLMTGKNAKYTTPVDFANLLAESDNSVSY